MPRLSYISAFLFTILVCFTPQALAGEAGCESQLYQGAGPVLKNAKLAAQTYPVCFSEISLLFSGIARTPLWSAEHLTSARIQRARTLLRLRSDAFHEELSLPADLGVLGDAHLSKPFTGPVLLQTLQRVLHPEAPPKV